MTRTKLSPMLLLAAAACSDPPTEPPAPEPPPPWGVPISGGTMLITRAGTHAVIADPDRDRILSFELAREQVVAEVALAPGDEPGRLVEDAAGRIHVALRRGGAIATLADPAAAQVTRRPACSEPRGLAYDAATDQLHVACGGGELVTFAAGGDELRRQTLDRDLRDVLVVGSELFVTRFRSAEVLVVDAQGAIASRASSPVVQRDDFDESTGTQQIVDAVPAVAWRSIALPDGRVLVSHQRAQQKQLGTKRPGGYGGGCGGGGGPVEAAVTIHAPGQLPLAVAPLVSGALPVDVAVSPAGDRLAFALAGANRVHQVAITALGRRDEDKCPQPGGDDLAPPISDQLGAPTSLAYAADGALVIYYPELPALAIHRDGNARAIQLPGTLGYDAGRQVFHQQTATGLACASCHPEGREDGLVWRFESLGLRRTQSLAGGILARAPYHWSGDMADLGVLMDDVFSVRMSGGVPTRSQKLSLGPWLDRIPAPAPMSGLDPEAVARGQQIFESDAVGCATCHTGALLTTNARLDVGTRGLFKVPSLRGVAARAPYMHDGCAATLADRFGTACGGGDLHGKTSQLTAAQRADLVTYLESL